MFGVFIVFSLISISLSAKTDTYHDQVMRDLISTAKALFEMTDTDNNGFLDRDEMMTLIDKALNGINFWNEEQAMRLRWAMDKNGLLTVIIYSKYYFVVDEKVDLNEFLSFEDWFYKIINMRNMDRRISIERLIKRGDGSNRPYFAELDKNEDGYIEESEINTAKFRNSS